jgi:hypothetical protein
VRVGRRRKAVVVGSGTTALTETESRKIPPGPSERDWKEIVAELSPAEKDRSKRVQSRLPPTDEAWIMLSKTSNTGGSLTITIALREVGGL